MKRRQSQTPIGRLIWLLAILGLVIAACGDGTGTEDPEDTTTTVAEDTSTTAEDEMTTTSSGENTGDEDEPVTIGYISGGEASPFVSQASENIREVTAEMGVELVECDTEFLAEKAVECGRTIAAANPDAVINWQFHPDASEAVCDAYDNVPTVTMDTPNEPCAEVFVGADNYAAGIIAGTALGEYAESELACEFDFYMQVELPSLVDVNEQRAGGTREGFEQVCGAIPDDKYLMVDKEQGGDDYLENIRRITTDLLSANPDAGTIIVSSPFSDADGVTMVNAFDTAGRGDDLEVIVAHGAEAIGHEYIRDDDRWLGSVAYFPERYGELAVPAAIDLALGESVPEEILIDHQLITKDNIDDIYPTG